MVRDMHTPDPVRSRESLHGENRKLGKRRWIHGKDQNGMMKQKKQCGWQVGRRCEVGTGAPSLGQLTVGKGHCSHVVMYFGGISAARGRMWCVSV